MSSIVTFYSYKGGVGRSMALANIAVELSKKGMKVLMIDWDLEAPGLERYFSKFIREPDMNGMGLLPMLFEVSKDVIPDYKKFLWEINIPSQLPISLLHSGREKDPDYARKLENLDWERFFADNGGGSFLESLRDRWKEDYDIVLIDSRTGLSDASGICTIYLPDVIVPMFTANYQSLYGVRDLMRLAQHARQKLNIDRMPLTILPVPTRFGTRTEFKESQEWLDSFAEALKECYSDWLPRWVTPKQVLERIKIPQVDYFGFGEKLAVIEQGTNDPESMGYIYSKIASLLASDFKDLEGFMGERYKAQKEEYEKQSIPRSAQRPKETPGYQYDIFISYSPGVVYTSWIADVFLPLLSNYLNEMGGTVSIFFERTEVINSGDQWTEALRQTLATSKILIAIVNGKYLQLAGKLMEWAAFTQRTSRYNTPLAFPIKLTIGEHLHSALSNMVGETQVTDLSKYEGITRDAFNTPLFLEFSLAIQQLAKEIHAALEKAPAFADNFPLLSPDSVKTISDILGKPVNV